MKKPIRSLRNAPPHIKMWWKNTNLSAAIFTLVANGDTWENAHERLQKSYLTWVKKGRKGASPLLRLSNRVHRENILSRIEKGETCITHISGKVAVNGSSFVLPRGNP